MAGPSKETIAATLSPSADAALSPEKPHLRVSHRMTRPDGSVTWVEKTGRGHFNEQGQILRSVGMVADITERKLKLVILRSAWRLLGGIRPQACPW